MWSVRVVRLERRRRRARVAPLAEVDRGAGRRLRRRRPAGLGAAGPALDDDHGRAGQGRRLGALARPSSAATRPAIRCRRSGAAAFRPRAERTPERIMTMTADRVPQPRPGVLDIDAYVPGKSSAPGVAKIFKLSSNETPLGPSPKAIEAYRDGRARISRTIRTAPRPRCARRSARAFGLDPDRIVCGAGSDELLNLLARAYLARRRRGDPHRRTASWSIRSRRSAPARKPVVAPEKNYTADVDAILARGDAEDQDRLPRQSEQPDRHLRAVRRGQAPARGPAAACAAGARRGLCRIRPAQRLRGRHRAGRDQPRTS